jgi:hypothetical protein
MKVSPWKVTYFVSSGVIGLFLTVQMSFIIIEMGAYPLDGKFLLAKHGWSAVFGVIFGSLIGALFTFYAYSLTRIGKRFGALIKVAKPPSSSIMGASGEIVAVTGLTAFAYASYLTGTYVETLARTML